MAGEGRLDEWELLSRWQDSGNRSSLTYSSDLPRAFRHALLAAESRKVAVWNCAKSRKNPVRSRSHRLGARRAAGNESDLDVNLQIVLTGQKQLHLLAVVVG
jgi:hypothetical protein